MKKKFSIIILLFSLSPLYIYHLNNDFSNYSNEITKPTKYEVASGPELPPILVPMNIS